MNLQVVGWGDMNWIDVGQVRDRWWPLVNAVMNFRFLKCRDFLEKLWVC
jgi:hypothetical protein